MINQLIRYGRTGWEWTITLRGGSRRTYRTDADGVGLWEKIPLNSQWISRDDMFVAPMSRQGMRRKILRQLSKA